MEETRNAIWDFVASAHVFTLATCNGEKPHCAPCFYAFDPVDKLLVFKSKNGTRHIADLLVQSHVAGSILSTETSIGKIKGIQFWGEAMAANEWKLPDPVKQLYYKQFPVAVAIKGNLWVIRLTRIKMTDNTFGFGSKIYWERPT